MGETREQARQTAEAAHRDRLHRAALLLFQAAEILAEEAPRKTPQVLDLVVLFLNQSGDHATADAVAEKTKALRSVVRSAVRRGEM